MSKSVLCTCEDVTLDDVRHAIDKGYRDIESIKRYIGGAAGRLSISQLVGMATGGGRGAGGMGGGDAH